MASEAVVDGVMEAELEGVSASLKPRLAGGVAAAVLVAVVAEDDFLPSSCHDFAIPLSRPGGFADAVVDHVPLCTYCS